jgi:hypothetical protein
VSAGQLTVTLRPDTVGAGSAPSAFTNVAPIEFPVLVVEVEKNAKATPPIKRPTTIPMQTTTSSFGGLRSVLIRWRGLTLASRSRRT